MAMNKSSPEADALDIFIDRLQGHLPPAEETNVETDTAEFALELHQLARQAPRRMEARRDLERRLRQPELYVAPVAAERHGPVWPRASTTYATWFRAAEVAAVVVFVVAVVAVVVVAARVSAPRQTAAPTAAAAQLIASFAVNNAAGTYLGSTMRMLDPETLADSEGMPSLEVGPCAAGPVLDGPRRNAAIALNGGFQGPPGCSPGSTLTLQLVDLERAGASHEVQLDSTPDRAIELAWTPPSPPLLWSPDGSRLYVFTVSRPANTQDWLTGGASSGEVRQLWLVDPTGSSPPTAVELEAAPWRMSFSPSRHGLFVLGYQTRGPSRWGYFDPGSTVLLMLDPTTGVRRAVVPLPGVKVAALPGASQRWYDPGVGFSPNGRYYFVAHPDAPQVDVVDISAPGHERVERSVVTDTSEQPGTSTLASLAVSPDGRRVYVHRWNGFPKNGVGLATHALQIGTWTVDRVDVAADYMRLSRDGRWLFAFDGPLASPLSGQQLDFKNAPGAGLRVLDPGGKPVTRLVHDQWPLQIAQIGPNRLYAVLPGADFDASQPFVVSRAGQDVFTIVAYETGTWRELARRSWHLPIYLVDAPQYF
jgi:hypothetical protein